MCQDTGASILVRLSGTEPKIKVYLRTKGPDANLAKYSQRGEALKQ